MGAVEILWLQARRADRGEMGERRMLTIQRFMDLLVLDNDAGESCRRTMQPSAP